jgi:ferritin-like metal-binding protein YciE
MSRNTHEEMISFVSDLYSVELQALSQLKNAPRLTRAPDFARYLEIHYEETGQQADRMRELLERLGGSPSHVKDAVMRLGGHGFLLLAKVLSETPGRLLAHAYSYEAMEWAGYTILLSLAEAERMPAVAEVARSIRSQERAMIERLETCFDAVEAEVHEPLEREAMPKHLCRHLAEAHALEKQSRDLLARGARELKDTVLQDVFRRHLGETETQLRELERRLEHLGGETSLLEDAAMRLGALNWGGFFKAQEDTSAKLTAFAYAFEHLEIGGYELLARTARRARDDGTIELVGRILREERAMAEALAENLQRATLETLVEIR